MSSITVFRLNDGVRFKEPQRWSVQARYAFSSTKDKLFTVEKGQLAIYLGQRYFDGQQEHLYRFSDGRMGTLNGPPDDRFSPVNDPEVVALSEQVKTLPEMVAGMGLSLETISNLNPFALIVCPLCRGTKFTTQDMASVWCDNCNTRFTTRVTAGDPGVVVDADPAHYLPTHSYYIIPHRGITLTVVLKDFGYSTHPEGKCGSYCVNGTTYEEQVEQTRDYTPIPTSLRDPSHRCGLEVYDWSLYGQADPNRHEPELRSIIGDPNAAEHIYGKKVYSKRLPDAGLLAEGGPDEREWWYLANVLHGQPVWWKVRAKLVPALYGERQIVSGWIVTDQTLCPDCLRPAAEGDHKYCDWEEIGWHPEEKNTPAQLEYPRSH